MWVRLQEAYGENNSWNAGKQIKPINEHNTKQTNKQKAEQRIQKLPTMVAEFKVCILPNEKALVSTSNFQLKTQRATS